MRVKPRGMGFVPQDENRSRIIEKNLGLVGQVIKDKVHNIHNIGIFTYEDLFQIGCIGLCKAVDTYREGEGRFSTYAYALIRNEIFDALKYATFRRNREAASNIADPQTRAYEEPAMDFVHEILQAVRAARLRASGITAKGIDALLLLAQGYTHSEIGARMGGVSANNISAWVTRARKFLRPEPAIISLGRPE